MSPSELKDYSEILKNAAEVLAVIGGLWAYFKWRAERQDRSTDVLFELERAFNSPDVRAGSQLVEDDDQYDRLRPCLIESSLPPDEIGEQERQTVKAVRPGSTELAQLDALLRFFIVLRGMRESRQVKDTVLSTCYRFWLAQYFNPCRREFRLYVRRFFPTLHNWLVSDGRLSIRRSKRSFFRPEGFGWSPRRTPGRNDLRRAIAGRVLVITGSGISADSGIPTYRGAGGYWRSFNARKLATRAAFDRSPELVWEWYRERRQKIRSARPNAAHIILSKLAARAQHFLLVTQNVDDLHERAETKPDQLVHIHGSIFRNACTVCDFAANVDNATDEPADAVAKCPRCPACDAVLRPGVVWFDENLHPDQTRRIEQFLAGDGCDLILVIGTTAVFDYIVNYALRGVRERGYLIEVNPEETYLSAAADLVIRKGAAQAIPKLIGRLLDS
ncbi:MAG TPA: Sir2 family NAD-dependent protein deacetylase [Blastocatellia bacterium]|nr:Sir2 family NAD-dependent protein deacetylase [Blastocatellia bacterium]